MTALSATESSTTRSFPWSKLFTWCIALGSMFTCVIVLANSAYHQNLYAVAALVFGGIVGWLSLALNYWLARKIDTYDAYSYWSAMRSAVDRGWIEFAIVCFVPLTITVVFFSWVFSGNKTYVVDGAALTRTSFIVPFTHTIEVLEKSQDVQFGTNAVTKDGIMLGANINAHMSLSEDKSTWKSVTEMERLKNEALTKAFQAMIRQKTGQEIEAMPGTFMLEFNTGQYAEIERSGAVLDGTLEITAIHPIFVPKKK